MHTEMIYMEMQGFFPALHLLFTIIRNIMNNNGDRITSTHSTRPLDLESKEKSTKTTPLQWHQLFDALWLFNILKRQPPLHN